MTRVLLLLGAVLAGAAVYWALLPVDAPVAAGPRATSTPPPGTTAAAPAGKSPVPDAPVVEPPVRPARPLPVARPGNPSPNEAVAAPRAAPAAGGPSDVPAAPPPDDGPRTFGRPSDQGPVRTHIGPIKDTLRRYYGNLPRNGVVPARITADELFPPALLRQIGVPDSARVVELGSFPTNSHEGFKEALALPDDADSVLGVTLELPDGTRVRDYLFTHP